MKKGGFVLKKDIEKKIIQTSEDVAIIKSHMPEMKKKIEKHDWYITFALGAITLLGFAVANIIRLF